jgi:hypothetical protein
MSSGVDTLSIWIYKPAMTAVVAIVLAIAVGVFAFLFRYQLVPVGNQSHRIDRFTGQTSVCDDRGCRPIENYSAESWKAVEARRKTEAAPAAEPGPRAEKRATKDRRRDDKEGKEESIRDKIEDALKRIK